MKNIKKFENWQSSRAEMEMERHDDFAEEYAKVVEAYEMEMERHDDFAEEHAKLVIASFIDDKLEGGSIESAFAKMVKDFGLEDSPQEMTIQALETLAEEILHQIGNLEVIKPVVE